MKSILVQFPKDQVQIIHGGAKGVDSMAQLLAQELGLRVESYPADWKQYGRAAGPIRNRTMLDLNPKIVYLFHPKIEQSKGTKDVMEEVIKRGIPYLLIQ